MPMVSPYVQEAAKRARILGTASEPEIQDPGFDHLGELPDPTVPDYDCDFADHRISENMLGIGLFLCIIAGIAFTLGWLAVSGLGHN